MSEKEHYTAYSYIFQLKNLKFDTNEQFFYSGRQLGGDFIFIFIEHWCVSPSLRMF